VTRAVATLLAKDLRVELRTRESVPAMALFAVCVFVLFHFGLDQDAIDGALAAGVLWVTLLLAAVLGVGRLFVAEREQGGLEGLLLAPIDRTAVWVAKAAALFIFLVALELVTVPAFALLLLGPGLLEALGPLTAILLLADVGLAAVGALVAALAVESRARELIAALLFLPLVVPVVVAGAAATEPLFSGSQAPQELGRWLVFLAIYNALFVVLPVAVFDYLLED
jgi:heme exporter protein B